MMLNSSCIRLFIIAIISMFTIGFQNYFFAASAASLTQKLRSLSFRAVLRQDSESLVFFRIAHAG